MRAPQPDCRYTRPFPSRQRQTATRCLTPSSSVTTFRCLWARGWHIACTHAFLRHDDSLACCSESRPPDMPRFGFASWYRSFRLSAHHRVGRNLTPAVHLHAIVISGRCHLRPMAASSGLPPALRRFLLLPRPALALQSPAPSSPLRLSPPAGFRSLPGHFASSLLSFFPALRALSSPLLFSLSPSFFPRRFPLPPLLSLPALPSFPPPSPPPPFLRVSSLLSPPPPPLLLPDWWRRRRQSHPPPLPPSPPFKCQSRFFCTCSPKIMTGHSWR